MVPLKKGGEVKKGGEQANTAPLVTTGEHSL